MKLNLKQIRKTVIVGIASVALVAPLTLNSFQTVNAKVRQPRTTFIKRESRSQQIQNLKNQINRLQKRLNYLEKLPTNHQHRKAIKKNRQSKAFKQGEKDAINDQINRSMKKNRQYKAGYIHTNYENGIKLGRSKIQALKAARYSFKIGPMTPNFKGKRNPIEKQGIKQVWQKGIPNAITGNWSNRKSGNNRVNFVATKRNGGGVALDTNSTSNGISINPRYSLVGHRAYAVKQGNGMTYLVKKVNPHKIIMVPKLAGSQFHIKSEAFYK